MPGVGTSGGNF